MRQRLLAGCESGMFTEDGESSYTDQSAICSTKIC